MYYTKQKSSCIVMFTEVLYLIIKYTLIIFYMNIIKMSD